MRKIMKIYHLQWIMYYTIGHRTDGHEARAMVIWRRADGEPRGGDLGPVSTALPEPDKAAP